MNKINNKALLSLCACPYLGPRAIYILEKNFSTLDNAFSASYKQLTNAGLSDKLVSKFITWRKTFSITSLLQQLQTESIYYISWHDDEYPKLFREINSPPPIIFYRGNISLLNKPHKLAIIGSRRQSPYAERILKEYLPVLVHHQIIIISGLALGVDSAAHLQTLNNAGLTIAVLGSGLKKTCFYPAANRQLADNIIRSGGLIISEFPPDMPARKNNFPRRNRLISGLAEAVLIVEAAKKSGSLITARFALEQNRNILAIPGNIFLESSAGTNYLIKEGAEVILEANDILAVLKITPEKASSKNKTKINIAYQPTDDKEKIIYELIKAAEKFDKSLNLDEISQKTKLDTATINSTLSILEIKKVIINRNGYFNLNF